MCLASLEERPPRFTLCAESKCRPDATEGAGASTPALPSARIPESRSLALARPCGKEWSPRGPTELPQIP